MYQDIFFKMESHRRKKFYALFSRSEIGTKEMRAVQRLIKSISRSSHNMLGNPFFLKGLVSIVHMYLFYLSSLKNVARPSRPEEFKQSICKCQIWTGCAESRRDGHVYSPQCITGGENCGKR